MPAQPMALVQSLVIHVMLANCVAPATGDEPADREQIAHTLGQLESNLLGEDAEDMVRRDVRARIQAGNDAAGAAWREIDSAAEWERYRDPRLQTLRKSLGQFPDPPRKLEVRVTDRIEGDGFVIENTVFESRSELWVTANVYVPAGTAEEGDAGAANRPGIIVGQSHHTPKENGELQDMGMTWARQGCVVIVPDYLGYGERRQHPFTSQNDWPGDFQLGRQDYYFRYDTGVQLHLVGDSLLGWLVWDLMRCVDYLLQRPDVDDSRIIMLGSVAGGGEPVATAAALDRRIACAVPFNYGGPQPETRYPLPEDAETRFNYAGSGGWESTRNHRMTAAPEGSLPWVIVGAIAPRPLGYAHEFSWDRERDPVWKRLNRIYGFYDAPGNIAGIHGGGVLTGPSSEATHCTHIGKVHRAMIHPRFREWFGIDVQPEDEYSGRVHSSLLQAMTAEAKDDLEPKLLIELLPEIANQRMARARERYENAAPAERREALRELWDRVLAPSESVPLDVPASRVVSVETVLNAIPEAEVQRVVLQVERELRVPLLLVRPAAVESPFPVVVCVAQSGKAGFLKSRAAEIAWLLDNGIAVCLADLRATGETDPGGRGAYSSGTAVSSSEMMVGGTMIGARLRDLRAVLAWLRSQEDVDARRLAVWGDSFAPVNSPDANFKVPRRAGSDLHQSEPGGALVALLAGLYDDDLAAIYASGGLEGFRSVPTSQIVFVPHDVVVPGILTTGDLCDLAGGIAPRPLRLAEVVDELNCALDAPAVRTAYARTRAAYEKAGAPAAVSFANAEASPAEWLAEQLEKPSR